MIYKASNASITRTAQVRFSSLRFTGNKLKRTSRLSCGEKNVYTGVQYCSGYSLFRTYHDGICGTYDTLYESNSATCGYTPPPPPPPPGPPTCTPTLECLNDACSACGAPCCVGGVTQCACQAQLNADCSRTCFNACC